MGRGKGSRVIGTGRDSAYLGQRRAVPDRGRGFDKRFEKLLVERDVAFVLGVPLNADNPPSRFFTFEGLDQAVGSKSATRKLGASLRTP